SGEPDRPGKRDEPRVAHPEPEERELVEVLLSEPALVPLAATEVSPDKLQHAGLRRLLEGLYSFNEDGEPASLNLLGERLNDPELETLALELEEVGRANPDRHQWFEKVLAEFRRKHHVDPLQQELKNQLVATSDHATALDLLRRLQHTN